jgi:hypothetical protein
VSVFGINPAAFAAPAYDVGGGAARPAFGGAVPLGHRPSASEEPAKQDDDTERSGFTKAITLTALVGGAAKGIVVDRARLISAFPHARSQGKTGKWLAEMVSGKITNDIVPIEGGTLKLFGKTITTKAWQHSYQVSNTIGLTLLAVNTLYGIPNLIEGWNDGGGTVQGLMTTKQGRTGVFATAGNLFYLGLMSTAFAQAPAGAGRVSSMLKSPLLSNGKVIIASLLMGVPVMLNELGFLDFLNTNSNKSWLENGRDTIDHHLDTIRGVLHLT